jgi:lysine decarboxylase
MILIDVSGLEITGDQAADWLYEHRRLGAEHHDLHHLMFIVTVADHDRTVERLIAAMRDLVAAAPEMGAGGAPPSLPPVSQLVGGYAMPSARAFLGTTRRVDLANAAREIAAEPVSPCPPGVPLLVPGNASTTATSSSHARALRPACSARAVSDPSLEQSASSPESPANPPHETVTRERLRVRVE